MFVYTFAAGDELRAVYKARAGRQGRDEPTCAELLDLYSGIRI
jgi:hypothetical protein